MWRPMHMLVQFAVGIALIGLVSLVFP